MPPLRFSATGMADTKADTRRQRHSFIVNRAETVGLARRLLFVATAAVITAALPVRAPSQAPNAGLGSVKSLLNQR
jgi:hypothetical protein